MMLVNRLGSSTQATVIFALACSLGAAAAPPPATLRIDDLGEAGRAVGDRWGFDVLLGDLPIGLVWFSSSLAGQAHNGATFVYAQDPNGEALLTHPDQDGPPLTDRERFVTFASQPFPEDALPRFRSGGAVWNNFAPPLVAKTTEVDNDFLHPFDAPTRTSGYLLRVVIDISGTESRLSRAYAVSGEAPEEPDDVLLAQGVITATIRRNFSHFPQTEETWSIFGVSDDCNNNGVSDAQDVATGTSLDCDGDVRPDECEADCNRNGVADDCDLAEGVSRDCNGNRRPDRCDLANTGDCNGNGIPDDCEPDCNNNGLPDECELGRRPRSTCTLYVDRAAPPGGNGLTWESAYDDLQYALTQIGPGSSLRIAQGTYIPSQVGDRTARFDFPDTCAIEGGYAGRLGSDPDARDPGSQPTILSGDLAGDGDPPNGAAEDNSYAVASLGAGTVLDGVVVRGGNNVARNDPPREPEAGGLIVLGSDALLRNCRILRNAGPSGGLAVDECADRFVIEDCLFLRNTARIVGGATFGEIRRIAGCRFERNTAEFGGGAVYSRAPLRIDHSEFIANTTSGNGGALLLEHSPYVTSCLFDGNHGGGGAASIAGSGFPRFYNCTMVNNTGRPNVLVVEEAFVMMYNSIVWSNDPNGIGEPHDFLLEDDAVLYVSDSTIQGWSGDLFGGSSDGLDPLFADAPAGNFRLTAGSPAIDAGRDGTFPRDEFDDDQDCDTTEHAPFDLDRRRRRAGQPATIDRGAYEFAAGPAGPCPGDLDGNRVVDVHDLQILLLSYHADNSGDLNCDGTTDLTDLAIVLAHFKAGCDEGG